MRKCVWVALVLAYCLSVSSWGADTISIQGVLEDSDGVPLATGTYSMRFSLYDAASGGTQRWVETHDAANKVTVTAGNYSAELGGITAFAAGLFTTYPDLWLEIEVDTDNSGTFEAGELFSPRVKLTSAPYAHQAKNADALEGQSASAFASATHTHDGSAIVSGTVAEGVIDGAIARDTELSSQISTHAGTANAHHTWPLTEADIPDAIARDSEISPRQFEAIVAPSGSDYTTIQAALAAGKKTIFVRNGTYTLSSDINITASGISIIGESRDGVVIDCNNAAYGIRAIGDTAVYEQGTVSINNGSSTVTGSGTSWTGNVVAGDYIRLNHDLYKIQSVNSNTQLTLSQTYRGRTVSGATYWIASILADVSVQTLRVTRSASPGSTGAICFRLVLNGLICNCIVDTGSGIGIEVIGYHCKLNKNYCCYNSGHAIYVEGAYNTVCENSCVNNDYIGIKISGVWANAAVANMCSGNSLHGIETDGEYAFLTANVCNNNNGRGIHLAGDHNVASGNSCSGNNNDGIEVDSDRNSVTNNVCTNNSVYGVDVQGDYNAVTSNQLSDNSSGAGNDAGTGTIKANNYPAF